MFFVEKGNILSSFAFFVWDKKIVEVFWQQSCVWWNLNLAEDSELRKEDMASAQITGWCPKFTFSTFTPDPNLHTPHIYTRPKFTQTQIYTRPIFTQSRFTQTHFWTYISINPNLHNPNLHKTQIYTTQIYATQIYTIWRQRLSHAVRVSPTIVSLGWVNLGFV